jgi:hypothetical protein
MKYAYMYSDIYICKAVENARTWHMPLLLHSRMLELTGRFLGYPSWLRAMQLYSYYI